MSYNHPLYENEVEERSIQLLVGHTSIKEVRQIIERLAFAVKDTGDLNAERLIPKIEQAVIDWHGEPLSSL